VFAQSVIVAVLVLGCAIYATWTLLPASARRSVALALLKQRLPGPVAILLRKHAQASTGCGGCDGCDHSSKKKVASVQSVNFHPRPRR